MIDLLRREAAHLHQSVRLDNRKIVVGEIPLFYQLLSDFIFDAIEKTETDDRPIDLFFQFFGGHDLDVPAAKLAGQANVLAASPDGQR